ncbi:MAG: thioredoxin [Candidatus Peregrinibacteria bacterium]|nr:thioredoxin [Candidatus Peregrinibacteria bacterium]
MAVFELNDSNFQKEVLDLKGKPVLVDFWAPWCGPCRIQGPIMEELGGEVGDKALIAKLNVDENMDTSGKYGIMSIPSLLVFKDGEVLESLVGVHQKEDLMELVNKYA